MVQDAHACALVVDQEEVHTVEVEAGMVDLRAIYAETKVKVHSVEMEEGATSTDAEAEAARGRCEATALGWARRL